ncbi:hypothetical protein MHBO_001056 [Bonamia ostreae]|uniref:Uncharacterized protein n=1 Tax=Bonamia ostreae TaxID=126728 RepID=A0ABV2AIJ4_9EUKA
MGNHEEHQNKIFLEHQRRHSHESYKLRENIDILQDGHRKHKKSKERYEISTINFENIKNANRKKTLSKSLKIEPLFKVPNCKSIAISENGSTVLALYNTTLHIWKSGERIRIKTNSDFSIAAFSPSSDIFATGDVKGVVRIWYTADIFSDNAVKSFSRNFRKQFWRSNKIEKWPYPKETSQRSRLQCEFALARQYSFRPLFSRRRQLPDLGRGRRRVGDVADFNREKGLPSEIGRENKIHFYKSRQQNLCRDFERPFCKNRRHAHKSDNFDH